MYEIKRIDDCSSDQLAFAVNHDSMKIIVGKSGHAKLLSIVAAEPVDYPTGGWIFRRKGQIADSGMLKTVKKDREEIIEMLKMLFC